MLFRDLGMRPSVTPSPFPPLRRFRACAQGCFGHSQHSHPMLGPARPPPRCHPAARPTCGRRRPARRPPPPPAATVNELDGPPPPPDAASDIVPLPGQFLTGLNGARLPLGALSLRLPGAAAARLLGGAAGTRDLSLVLPLDVDAVLDHYVDAGAGDADPYWARPWPSGAVLAATLVDNPSLVAGRTVVDLGAGLGLAGLGAARAGAARVLITDRDPLALQCAAASAAASGVVVDVAALDWRDGDALAAARADVVLAADVLYERDAAAPVADALAALVAPGGTAIVADPAARAPAIRAAFADALAGRLVLESWRAVDGDSGAAVAVGGGDGAPPPRGAVLLLTLVSPVAAHSVRAREWP